MWWLTWRQHRAQVLTTAVLLAIIGVALLIHGLSNADMVRELAGTAEGDREIRAEYREVFQVLDWLVLAPVLFGLFWGAPVLAREFEQGTHILAWTQSVSRRRWLAVKLGVLGLLAVLAGLALGAIVGAWASVFEEASGVDRLGDPSLFTLTGIVPAAWWLFAFALGTAAGALFRKTVMAMALTFAGVIGAFILVFVLELRSDLVATERVVSAQQSGLERVYTEEQGLIVDGGWLTPDGKAVDPRGMTICREVPPTGYQACVAERGYKWYYDLHPPDQYWVLQWTDAGMLGGAALVLGGVTLHSATRRRI